jgi:ribosomal protein S25
MLKQEFGDEALSKRQTHEWYKRYRERRKSVKGSGRSRRTTKNEENIQKVRKVFRSNRRLTVHVVAEETGISKSTCVEILSENLGMLRVAAEFVPHLLSADQIQNRVDISRPCKCR